MLSAMALSALPKSLFGEVHSPNQYWQSTAAAEVINALRRSTYDDDQRRRYYWRALHGFLHGVHREHLEKRLAITHPKVSQLWNKEESGHRYFPLIQLYADRLAVVFNRPAEFWLIGEDGERLPESDPRVQQWRRDEEDAEIDVTLQEVERQIITLNQTFVEPAWCKGKMRWLVRAPYEMHVDPDPEDPAGLDGAPHVSVELPQNIDALNSTPVSYYMTWRRVDNRDQAGRITGSRHEVFVHDLHGNQLQNSLFPDNVNHYGAHPIVVWRGGKKPPAGTFWLPANIGWYHQQVSADISLCDLDYIMRYQAHSVAVARGGMDVEFIETGPASLIKTADTDFDFQFVTPDPNIAELIDAFNMNLRTSAVAESLPPDVWQADSTVRNLGAKQLEQLSLKMRRQRVVPAYMRALRKTFAAHKRVADYWANSGADRVELGNVRLGVGLAAIMDAEDRFQSTQAALIEMSQLGLDNPVDSLMRRHGITRSDAERMYERNKSYALPGSAPMAAKADDGTQRPASVRRGD